MMSLYIIMPLMLKFTGLVFWLLLGRFLGVVYVALAVHIFVTGIGQLGLLP